MKIKFVIGILLLLIAKCLNAQTATSVNNGSWLNPFTWSCTCIPLPNYQVTINHQISLDTSWVVNSGGSITINANGKLEDDSYGRNLWLNGGSITNAGTMNFKYIYTQTGTLTNSGTIQVNSILNMSTFINNGTLANVDSFYTDGLLTNNGNIDVGTFYNASQMNNHGTILNVDSITNGGTLNNFSDGIISADSMTNIGTLVNDGVISQWAVTNMGTYTNNNSFSFYDFTNLGTFVNTDSVVGTNSFLNLKHFNNLSSAVFTLQYDFLNTDSVSHDAVFNNEGSLSVGHNFYNYDTVKGVDGSIEVQNFSYNEGIFSGSFDFCDLTPIATTSPFIDQNTGSVSANITWCTNTEVQQITTPQIQVYPNPASDYIAISISQKHFTAYLFNSNGEKVLTATNSSEFDLKNLAPGFYFLTIESNGIILCKEKIVKM